MMFLARYWRVLAIGLTLAAFLIGLQRCTANAERRGYQRARDEMAIEVARANARTAALEQRQRAKSDKAAQAWERDRNDLQSQVDRLVSITRPVRLCRAASSAPVPSATSPAGSFDDPAGQPLNPLQAGRDVGPELVQLGGECERYRQQLSALQSWITETR